MPGQFEKEFGMAHPVKLAKAHKKADDVCLGSTDSWKLTFKSKAANGTKVKSSTSVKAGEGPSVSKFALEFAKAKGFCLEKFEASTKGSMSASAMYSEVVPDLDVSFGLGKDKSDLSGFVAANYVHDLLNLNLKGDYFKKTAEMDANIGYENFMLGFETKYAGGQNTFGGMLGTTFGNGSLLTIQAKENATKCLVTGYFVPTDGIQVAFEGSGTGKDDVNVELRSAFALDDKDTSLTATLTTTPLILMDDSADAKFRVGLCYAQKIKEWCSMKLSGEVGIKDVKHVAFGVELEASC